MKCVWQEYKAQSLCHEVWEKSPSEIWDSELSLKDWIVFAQAYRKRKCIPGKGMSWEIHQIMKIQGLAMGQAWLRQSEHRQKGGDKTGQQEASWTEYPGKWTLHSKQGHRVFLRRKWSGLCQESNRWHLQEWTPEATTWKLLDRRLSRPPKR